MFKGVKMGRASYNVEAVCDHATPEKDSALRLHMDLPISHEEFQVIQEKLDVNDWAAVKVLMLKKYPELQDAIGSWLKNGEARALGALHHENRLRIVNG
ncbi:hypothetical protein QTI17_07320 [Variovorax sp. J31P179]|uniref:hypothetical protein n=1 Tax=Variovorax sp. J31P179 TaxID=3053508 RepID=UPI002577A2A7|nr:hypothetical protein [Variovorax sp. J31P179]MDM0080398.1 hypothetical protein [Variovorax sp. J31P179]